MSDRLQDYLKYLEGKFVQNTPEEDTSWIYEEEAPEEDEVHFSEEDFLKQFMKRGEM